MKNLNPRALSLLLLPLSALRDILDKTSALLWGQKGTVFTVGGSVMEIYHPAAAFTCATCLWLSTLVAVLGDLILELLVLLLELGKDL